MNTEKSNMQFVGTIEADSPQDAIRRWKEAHPECFFMPLVAAKIK